MEENNHRSINTVVNGNVPLRRRGGNLKIKIGRSASLKIESGIVSN